MRVLAVTFSLFFFLFLFLFFSPWKSRASSEKHDIPAVLTEGEKRWIAAHPVIRLAPDPDFRPIEYFDEKGDYSGIAADYARLVERKLGIRFEFVHCANWDDVIERARHRDVDVLNAVVKSPRQRSDTDCG